MVEQRIVAEGDTDFDAGELAKSLIEHQNIVFSTPRQLQSLFAGARARDLVSSL